MQWSGRFGRSVSWPVRLGLLGALVLGSTMVARAIITDLVLVGNLHPPRAEHVDQDELMALVHSGQLDEAFEEAFEVGDELFDTVFNAADGVGANVGDGQRFTRVPRADLNAPGQWGQHVPPRATGPNAESCVGCHNLPFGDAAGPAAANVHRDPTHSGSLNRFIQRNTPHLFAPGAVQRVAEEMTTDLQAIRDGAIASVCAGAINTSKTVTLVAKGVTFGQVTAQRRSFGGAACPPPFQSRRFLLTTDRIKGIDTDLVVKPFQWKGSVRTVREFNRDALHNELGMQAVEIVGDDVDGDADGVRNEITIGDQTALAVYLAAQPRPTTKLELAALGLIPALTSQEVASIGRGAVTFAAISCASCHVPQLLINDPILREPSEEDDYRDAVFPAGQDPLERGVDPAFPVEFDLTKDQPDNIIRDSAGQVVFRLGSLAKDSRGRGVVQLFGDLKRHDIGSKLAERIDEVGTGASVFLTENLWGVGSTPPYLHDGRATTLTEAILEHGGEASASRDAFTRLQIGSQRDLIAFLDNLVLFKMEEEE